MVELKVAYRVQSIAGRDTSLARLLARLPPGVEVIVDDEARVNPNPCRGYLNCLRGAPPDATHLCVMQDDALPCFEVDRRIQEAVGEHPDEVVSLFVGGLSGRTRKDFWEAMKRGDRWTPVYFREIHHVVALVWPIPLVNEFLDWYENARIPGPIPPKSDDAVVGYWARTQKKLFWATVPCLVEHPDDVPSTIHRPERQGDQGRRAIHFIE